MLRALRCAFLPVARSATGKSVTILKRLGSARLGRTKARKEEAVALIFATTTGTDSD